MSHTAFFLSVCMLSARLNAGAAGPETFNGPAIKVNAQVVSIREVEQVFSDSYLLIQDKLRKGEISQDKLASAIRNAWTEALDNAMQDKILDQRADKRRKDIMNMYLSHSSGAVSPERALEYFKRAESEYIQRLRHELIAAAGGEEELRQALKRRDQTMHDWESGLSRELFRRDVLGLELGPISRSPAAARAFYDQHPEQFKQDDAWRLRRIRITKKNFSGSDVALNAAKIVCEKIAKGGDFAEVASKISDDPEFSTQGGMLMRNGKPDQPTGNFPAEERIAANLQDGAVSEPIDTGDYFLIVQRLGYRPMKIQTFEDAADRAEALAFMEKLKQKKKELFDRLKDEAYIEVLQKDPPPHLLKGVKNAAGDFLAP